MCGHFCRVLLHEPTAGTQEEIGGVEQQSAVRGRGGGDSSGVAEVGSGVDRTS